MPTDLKISQFTAWTGIAPQGAFSQLEFATNDPANPTLAASGTDEKVTGSAILNTVSTTFFNQANTQVLYSNGTVPTSSANFTFNGSVLSSTTILAKTALRVEDPGAGTNYVAFQSPTLAGNTLYTLPATDGTTGQVLTTNGSAVLSWSSNGAGDVVGPASATDNALCRFDTTTGKLIQNSVGILSDAGALSGLTQLSVDNLDLNGNTISSTDVNGNIVLDPNGTGIVSSLANVKSTGGFTMVETGGGVDTITHSAPSNVTTSYTVIEAAAIPLAGQVPAVAGVVGTDVTMTWASVSTPVTSTVTTTWVGIWAAGQSGDLSATTDGTGVMLRFPAVSATANTAAVATNTGTALPVGLRPAATQTLPIFAITDNGVSSLLGSVSIATTGVITVSLAQAGIPHVQNGGTFTGSGASGWSAFTVAYVLV